MLEFNLYGMLILIMLFLISFFIKNILFLNAKYNYQKIDSAIKNKPISSIKDINSNINLKFKISNSYFEPLAKIKNKKIILKKDFFINNTLYEQINAIFYAYMFRLIYKKEKSFSLYGLKKSLKIINLLCVMLLMPLLILGLWFYILIPIIILILSLIIKLFLNQKIILKAITFAKEYILIYESKNNLINAIKILKRHKMDIFFEYLTLFIDPFFSLWNSFKKWGHDE